MKKVLILALPGCMATTVNGVLDVFLIANLVFDTRYGVNSYSGDRYFETQIVSADGNPVTSAAGQEIIPQSGLLDEDAPDLILVSGAFIASYNEHQIERYLKQQSQAIAWLSKMYQRGVTIASACTGSFMLAEAGFLKGKEATTHWLLERAFRKRYPEVIYNSENIVLTHDRLFCGAGATAFHDLALRLIEYLSTREIALICAKMLLSDPSRELQKPFQVAFFEKNHDDAEVLKAQIWIEGNYEKKIKIDEVASRFAMGGRNFQRRFKEATGLTPLVYVQKVRIEVSKSQLEMTQIPSHEIIRKVGYEDLSSYRRLFKKATGLTMESYRKKMSKAA